MLPWLTIDRADVPGGGELTLVRRGDEFAIRMNGAELMASRAHSSEEKMAVLAAEALGTKNERPRVFIGGLGLGYTLRATLDAFPKGVDVVVAELVPQVVTWVKGPLAHLAGNVLRDKRVTVVTDDAVEIMRRSPGRFDALLVDIDNAPTTLVRAKNAQLYSERGVQIAKTALTPKGVLVVWSGGPDARFVSRMKSAGFTTREERVSEHGRGGRGYTLFVGQLREPKKAPEIAVSGKRTENKRPDSRTDKRPDSRAENKRPDSRTDAKRPGSRRP